MHGQNHIKLLIVTRTILLRTRNVAEKKCCRENQKTFYVQ